MSETIAVIPARAGSKRLPHKNILDLCGKPLIAYTIEAAIESRTFDRIIVTSDSPEVLSLADQFGVIPLDRPAELCTDVANTSDVLRDAIGDKEGQDASYCLLQPTSPLRRADDIKSAMDSYRLEGRRYPVISVCTTDHHPYWSTTISREGFLEFPFGGEQRFRRSQELPKMFRLNGALYIGKVDDFLRTNSLFGEKMLPYHMSSEDSVDIDTKLDFAIAEILMRTRVKSVKTYQGRG